MSSQKKLSCISFFPLTYIFAIIDWYFLLKRFQYFFEIRFGPFNIGLVIESFESTPFNIESFGSSRRDKFCENRFVSLPHNLQNKLFFCKIFTFNSGSVYSYKYKNFTDIDIKIITNIDVKRFKKFNPIQNIYFYKYFVTA